MTAAARSSLTAVAAVVGAALVVILLVTWAASIGPDAVLTGDGPATNRVAMPTTTPPTLVGTPTSDIDRIRETATPRHDPVLKGLAYVLEAVAVALGLLVLWRLQRWLRQTYDARRRREARPEEIDFDVLEAPDVITEEILRDAADQRALLVEGPAGDAIVECWHRFELQAAAAGTSRRAWETSSEFTLRILELVAADDSAVTRLAGLYREARFSGHRMGEDDRAAAVAALDAIHAGLRHLSRGGVR